MEDLLSVTQPMSKNVGNLFPEFSPCNGTTGSTLLYSMDRKELFEAPAYIKARPVCWHVKKGGKNYKLKSLIEGKAIFTKVIVFLELASKRMS